MTHRTQSFRYVADHAPAAVIVAVQEPFQLAHEVASSALELARLARGLGIEVLRTIVQRRAEASSVSLLSEGRLRELARHTGGPGYVRARPRAPTEPSQNDAAESAGTLDYVLFDCSLTAGQQRALTLALNVEVLDRTGVILRIFEQRARTREARLQVELARLLYDAPRIRDDSTLGDREGGGGRGGRGHSNVELIKQQNRARTAALRRQLAEVARMATTRRTLRSELPRVSLVGYTNAGKSSLMRALTGSEVLVQDAPFATLDLTVRALTPESQPRILVSDTVGFINHLPHELIASFRATLDEAREAGLLLIVVDVSDAEWRSQLRVTRETLRALGAGDVPSLVLLNKADRLDPARRETVACELPDAMLLSARQPEDVARLRTHLIAHFERDFAEATFVVPYHQGALVAELHARTRVLSEDHLESGTRLRVRGQRAALGHLRRHLRAQQRARGRANAVTSSGR